MSTIEEYFTAIREIRSAWYPTPQHQDELWFRGQAQRSWPLLPGIYRPTSVARGHDDHTLFHAFRTQAAPFGEAGDDEWDWYFRAQHFGLPTRLLDWTSGALPALYFAIEGRVRTARNRAELRNLASLGSQFSDDSPVVWLMDAGTLNEHCAGIDALLATSSYLKPYLPTELMEDYSLLVEKGEVCRSELPVAIQPRWSNSRIIAQQGMFTIHGSAPVPIEELPTVKVATIILSSNHIYGFWRDLVTAGVNEAVLFPEPASIAAYIRSEYVSEPKESTS